MVTGGAGFVASHICEILAQKGHETISFDQFPISSRLKTIPRNLKSEMGDITVPPNLVKGIKSNRIDGIIHAAAMLPPKDFEQPYKCFQANVVGTANILEMARIFDLKRIIVVSTAGVYGKRSDLEPIREDSVKNPEIVYEYTKLMTEEICRMYREKYGMDIGVVRYAFVYGPRQTLVFPINIVLYHALEKKELKLPEGLDHAMDYTYVKDAAEGTICAFESNDLHRFNYNIAIGRLVSVSEIVDSIKRIIPDFKCQIGPGPWPSEIYRAWTRGPIDISWAKTDLHFKPKYDIGKGIEEYISWLRDTPEEYQVWPKTSGWIAAHN